MKRLIIILVFVFSINSISSQEMDNYQLNEIFTTISDTIQGKNSR